MDFNEKKIGVWGFGIVGKSVTDYLCAKKLNLEVLEKKKLTYEEKNWLESKNISYFDQNEELINFLERNDIIIPSPGIDLRPYYKYQNKWLSELDLFLLNFKKPIIAITGTLGKTSITHLLTKLFNIHGIKAVAAGNIGFGMCELIENQNNIDLVILEVSSFQLDLSRYFKSTISLWTNFYPNHLDRHNDINSYFDAKFKIISNQSSEDNAIVPLMLMKEIYKKNVAARISFFSKHPAHEEEINLLRENDSIFYIENDDIFKVSLKKKEFIYSLKKLPEITFIENWLIICITLHLYNLKISVSGDLLDVPEHRLEKFAQIKEIEFYNDSKSTVPESTLAAVSKFIGEDIILFLGGLSKGIDRSILIKQLKNKVKTIICFGAEANLLKSFCDQSLIESYSCQKLEDAVQICLKIMEGKDKILFSPAGSSYDLYNIYTERGDAFKKLINSEIQKIK